MLSVLPAGVGPTSISQPRCPPCPARRRSSRPRRRCSRAAAGGSRVACGGGALAVSSSGAQRQSSGATWGRSARGGRTSHGRARATAELGHGAGVERARRAEHVRAGELARRGRSSGNSWWRSFRGVELGWRAAAGGARAAGRDGAPAGAERARRGGALVGELERRTGAEHRRWGSSLAGGRARTVRGGGAPAGAELGRRAAAELLRGRARAATGGTSRARDEREESDLEKLLDLLPF
ncbi:hypothetical protein PVAP13_5KG625807 [Panicum virgatum]|uniref:Uncharacterized protein n=1 Tax=Panicum virgatum TaxID=38727 RepID=A0A8T0SYE5_PANVG|nr:hypothetical protein PVAP13_5KG625807 [Panicum virgatum]